MSAAGGRVVIVGAGVAGLTTALALARAGFPVRVLERSQRLVEVGAGLQLSPNATRILAELGVLPRLTPVAVRPDRISIRKASTLAPLTSVPLGSDAVRRWGHPYLTVHRADLQSALLAEAARHPEIELSTGAEVRDAAFHSRGVTLSVDRDGGIVEEQCSLAVAADGVWSTLRERAFRDARSRDTGYIAWRAIARPTGTVAPVVPANEVTAFLHPGFHLVAYPIRGGEAINLVAVTKGRAGIGWSNSASPDELEGTMAGTAPALPALVRDAGPWTTWPLHEAPAAGPWTHPAGLVLIGDAAHAMSPYAAQGAAMAIEDAAMLAALAARHRGDNARLMDAFERIRRPRIRRAQRRGAFNRFTWHASGPVALARNLVMSLRPPSRNAGDLDWLYGWTVETALARSG